MSDEPKPLSEKEMESYDAPMSIDVHAQAHWRETVRARDAEIKDLKLVGLGERMRAATDRDRLRCDLDTARAALCGASNALLQGDACEAHKWLTRQEAYEKANVWKRTLEEERDAALARVALVRSSFNPAGLEVPMPDALGGEQLLDALCALDEDDTLADLQSDLVQERDRLRARVAELEAALRGVREADATLQLRDLPPDAIQTARKDALPCASCGRRIVAGAEYVMHTTLSDEFGDLGMWKLCRTCATANQANWDEGVAYCPSDLRENLLSEWKGTFGELREKLRSARAAMRRHYRKRNRKGGKR